ncbi:MAG: hypothetical protein AAB415_00025 [Patescibacteria group bacterium]
MKILIATGIYPPDIGGPAQYAFNLEQEFIRLGHEVKVIKFSAVRRLPSFIRHLVYFFKILFVLPRANFVLVLDTFSVALPAVVASKLFNKKVIIRTGGDFLWESYVERTGDLVLLRNFYQTTRHDWNLKEKIIFKLTRWILNRASTVVFSTDWQRQIWREPYQLNLTKTKIIENYCGGKEASVAPTVKNFVGGTRQLKWKNLDILQRAFARAREKNPELILDLETLPYDKFLEKIKSCYAVILVSLGDISPNLILDALRYNKPFILSHENGLFERLKEVAIFVDPNNSDDIETKIKWLADEKNYEIIKEKIKNFNFTHLWSDIAHEFLEL